MSNEIIVNSRGDMAVIKSKVVSFEIGEAIQGDVPMNREPAVLSIMLESGNVAEGFEVNLTDAGLVPLVERFRKLFEGGE